METAKCFKALGFSEMPEDRGVLDRVYEQRKKQLIGAAGIQSATESEKLTMRLLEENYRACLRYLAEQ